MSLTALPCALLTFAACLVFVLVVEPPAEEVYTQEVAFSATTPIHATPVHTGGQAGPATHTATPISHGATVPPCRQELARSLRFSRFDEDHGGILTKTEFLAGCRLICKRLTCGDVNCERLWSFADSNRNLGVDESEWEAIVLAQGWTDFSDSPGWPAVLLPALALALAFLASTRYAATAAHLRWACLSSFLSLILLNRFALASSLSEALGLMFVQVPLAASAIVAITQAYFSGLIVRPSVYVAPRAEPTVTPVAPEDAPPRFVWVNRAIGRAIDAYRVCIALVSSWLAKANRAFESFLIVGYDPRTAR